MTGAAEPNASMTARPFASDLMKSGSSASGRLLLTFGLALVRYYPIGHDAAAVKSKPPKAGTSSRPCERRSAGRFRLEIPPCSCLGVFDDRQWMLDGAERCLTYGQIGCR